MSNIITTPIDLASAATQINEAHATATALAGRAIKSAKQAGELLMRVKASLPHGEFLPWVEANCTVTPRQCQRYMNAAQGKPLPVRSIKYDTVSYLTCAPKNDTVSHLALNDGEAVYITRLADGWQDEAHIFPSAAYSGFFHYAFVSGAIGGGASCTYTNREMKAQAIAIVLNNDMPCLSDCTVERYQHDGYEKNPFSDGGAFVGAATPAPAPQTQKNLDLAREYVVKYIGSLVSIASGNEHLFKILVGDGDDVDPLPGATLSEITNNLAELLRLASMPAPVVNARKGNYRAEAQRKELVMVARVCLALLDGGAS